MANFEPFQGQIIEFEESPSTAAFALRAKTVGELGEGEAGYVTPEAILAASDGTLWVRRASLACLAPVTGLPVRVVRHGGEVFIDPPVSPEGLHRIECQSMDAYLPVRGSQQAAPPP